MSTQYTSKITMTLPLAMASIAASIGRALDPDVGGADSFRRVVTGYQDDETPIYGDTLVCSTLCTPEFRAQAEAMATQPELLYQVCQADYAIRWPDFESPSLSDCQAFCDSVVIT